MIRNRRTLLLIITLTVIQVILLIAINLLARENTQLKRAIQNTTPVLKSVHASATSKVANVNDINLRRFLPSEVTILLLKHFDKIVVNMSGTTHEEIKRLFPASPIKWNSESVTIGKSLNRMISEIRTEYFVVLEATVSLSKTVNESIDTLWDALERYPEIDFVGGSYLSGDKLHVSCQRFRFCRWTFSESYEYERSLDNIMICDGTSASFMGRRKSVDKIHGWFDEKISDLMVFKDFFIRAKAAKAVVATRPSFMLLVDQLQSLYDKWQSRDITKDLVAFAVKYKVFIFKEEDGNTFDMCSSTSWLSGKEFCIEKNAHQLMLNGNHWAFSGLYTYPFLLEYLKITLTKVTNLFEQHNVNYVVNGGVSLGAVKMHSILPWEAGDIDIYVYGMSVPQLLDLLQPWAAKMGYIVRKHAQSGAVHVFCTPKEIGDVSGGLATIFPFATNYSPKHMRIKTNGIWVRYARNLFQTITKHYGQGYLEHKLYGTLNTIQCKMKGHNACLPNFESKFNGKGGTYRENFCEI